MNLLPERIKWQEDENIMGLDTGRHFTARERGTGKPVIGKCMGTNLLYCYIDSMPNFEEKETTNETEWLIENPTWNKSNCQVDMQTTVDLGYMDKRYIEACVGTQLALFVKSTLLRARMTAGFHKKLTTLVSTPEQLAEYHNHQEFPLSGHTEAFMSRIEGKRGELLAREIAELKQRETQLQVVLLLELLDYDRSLEAVLDSHFDRLLMWQALSEQRQDSVVDFCSQVIWPFYRVSSHKKAEELFLRAKGKQDRITKEDKKLKKQVIAEDSSRFQKSVSFLERAQSMRESTLPESQRVQHLRSLGARAPTVSAKIEPSLTQLARREVEIGSKSRGKQPKRARPMATTEPASRKFAAATRSEIVHVFATPVSKRRVLLPKESVELPDLEIDSTDEDEPKERELEKTQLDQAS